MRRDLSGLRAIVTGASSGIGRAIAAALCQEGVAVVAVARREDRLRQLAEEVESTGGRLLALAGDVTDAPVRRAAVEQASSQWGGLDILVNNAGIGAQGRFEDANPEHLRRIMEVNFFAPVELIRLALPLLRESSRASIVNVGSVYARRGMPFNSEYCASKFALQGFSEAIRAELVRYGIGLLMVHPGTTATEFADHLIARTAKPGWRKPRAVSAEAVARATLAAIRRGRHEIIPHAKGRLLCWLNRLSPRLVDAIVART